MCQRGDCDKELSPAWILFMLHRDPPRRTRSNFSALSYDANVSRFVLHTGLMGLLSGSVQVGSAKHCLREAVTQQMICTHLFCLLSFSYSFPVILSALFCPPLLWLILFLFFSVCAHSPVFLIECVSRSQCCRRKLVAMLMSLFEALKASRASVLEKPISTNRAT